MVDDHEGWRRHIGTADMLLRIADSANPPDEHWASPNLILPASDGWHVAFFYDAGDLDYIDHFIAPDGSVINFWDWGEEPGLKEDIEKVMSWTSVRAD